MRHDRAARYRRLALAEPDKEKAEFGALHSGTKYWKPSFDVA
jgi:hypothetical protein